MQARRFTTLGEMTEPDSGEDYYLWSRTTKEDIMTNIKISKALFDLDGQLVNILPAKWDESFTKIEQIYQNHYNDNDLPF